MGRDGAGFAGRLMVWPCPWDWDAWGALARPELRGCSEWDGEFPWLSGATRVSGEPPPPPPPVPAPLPTRGVVTLGRVMVVELESGAEA